MNLSLTLACFIIILAVAVVATWNIGLNSQQEDLSGVSLANIEANANIIEDIGDWWNSKVHQCVPHNCSVTIGVPGIASYTNEGTIHNCESGSSNAHCWECDGCSARLF